MQKTERQTEPWKVWAAAMGIVLIVLAASTIVLIHQLQSAANTNIQSSPSIGTIQSVKPYTKCVLWVDCETGQTVTIVFNNDTVSTESSVCSYGFEVGQNVSLLEWRLGFLCS